MKNKVYASFDEAVADVPDGATFMSGGFAGIGVPRNLIMALVRQGAKDLTGISNNTGGQGEVVDVGKLVENGQIRKMVCAFSAAPHPSRANLFEKLNEQGQVEAELVPQGTLAERMRAAGAGVAAFYTPTGVGTETAAGKEHRVFNGRTYVLEYPLHADYAFVRAYRADTFGNLQFRRSQRNFNPVMAMAAKITIAEVEQDIVELGELDPDSIHTPGIVVDRVVKIPPPPEGIWDTPNRRA